MGAAERAAEQDRNPVSALGATVLGVQDRADEAVALLDDGDVAAATTAADDVTSRADKALLVGLALPVLLLLLLLAVVLVVRGIRRSAAGARARAQADREAALAPLVTVGPDAGPSPPSLPSPPPVPLDPDGRAG